MKKDEVYVCCDCGFVIKPPHGKPFSNGDGKTRCASCAVALYKESVPFEIFIKKESILSNCKS